MNSSPDFSALRSLFSKEDPFFHDCKISQEQWNTLFSQHDFARDAETDPEKRMKIARNVAFLANFSAPEHFSEEQWRKLFSQGQRRVQENFIFSPEFSRLALQLWGKEKIHPLFLRRIEKSQRFFEKHPEIFREYMNRVQTGKIMAATAMLNGGEKGNLVTIGRAVTEGTLPTQNFSISSSAKFSLKVPANFIQKKTTSAPEKSDAAFAQELAESQTPQEIEKQLAKQFRSLAEKTPTKRKTTNIGGYFGLSPKYGGLVGKIATGSVIATALGIAVGDNTANAAFLDFFKNL